PRIFAEERAMRTIRKSTPSPLEAGDAPPLDFTKCANRPLDLEDEALPGNGRPGLSRTRAMTNKGWNVLRPKDEDPTPLYLQVARKLAHAINAGRWQAEEALPPDR